jgi:hypothetical protein
VSPFRETLTSKLRQGLLALLLLLFCAAPTPGDVGGCGQSPDPLDPEVFFANKRDIDCKQCRACALATATCEGACSGEAPLPADFPEGCAPLVHDGEVCLRALHFASCDAYRSYVDDIAPTVPTECDFCPGGAP